VQEGDRCARAHGADRHIVASETREQRDVVGADELPASQEAAAAAVPDGTDRSEPYAFVRDGRKESSGDPPDECCLVPPRDRPGAPMHPDACEGTTVRDDRHELVGVPRDQVERWGGPRLDGEGYRRPGATMARMQEP
jgi:hypothetical protein